LYEHLRGMPQGKRQFIIGIYLLVCYVIVVCWELSQLIAVSDRSTSYLMNGRIILTDWTLSSSCSLCQWWCFHTYKRTSIDWHCV